MDNNTPYFCIESCQHCKDHLWCTRHDESKYQDFSARRKNPDILSSLYSGKRNP